MLDPHVAAVGPAQPLQRVEERCDASLTFAIGLRVEDQHTDPSHAVGLLRPRRERPGDSATAQKGDELASCCVQHGEFLAYTYSARR
jgi:hypothetical protein